MGAGGGGSVFRLMGVDRGGWTGVADGTEKVKARDGGGGSGLDGSEWSTDTLLMGDAGWGCGTDKISCDLLTVPDSSVLAVTGSA